MALPYWKVYPGDFLRDTAHMHGHERNAYLMLLMMQWQTGSLPDDDLALSRILGLSLRQWQKLAKAILPFFDRIEGRLVQARVALDRHEALQKREVKIKSGAQGGRAKALKNKQPPLANAIAKTYQTGVGVGDTTESPLVGEVEGKRILNAQTINLPCETDRVIEAFGKPSGGRIRIARELWEARCNGATLDEILEGARLWCEYAAGADPRFVPSLANWLRDGRWSETPPTKPVARNPIREAFADVLKRRQEARDGQGIGDNEAPGANVYPFYSGAGRESTGA
jgi:uncharacterized protein YdaU (DUF1376 family)